MNIKTAPFKVKAAGPDDNLADGEFIGYASVFGNVDLVGDIVDSGAFTKTLAEWDEKGDPIPVLWGHDTFDPFNNIGAAKAIEDERGLKIHGTLDLDNPTAKQVYRLLKGRRTTRMSFAYDVRDYEDAEDGLHLKDLDLFEVSVVQIPANPAAEVLTVKHAASSLMSGIKAGRVLSAKNETTLREARDAIDSVLASLGDDGKSAPTEKGGTQSTTASETTDANADANAEEPTGANAPVSTEEPTSETSAPRLAAFEDRFAALSG